MHGPRLQFFLSGVSADFGARDDLKKNKGIKIYELEDLDDMKKKMSPLIDEWAKKSPLINDAVRSARFPVFRLTNPANVGSFERNNTWSTRESKSRGNSPAGSANSETKRPFRPVSRWCSAASVRLVPSDLRCTSVSPVACNTAEANCTGFSGFIMACAKAESGTSAAAEIASGSRRLDRW